MYQSACRHPLLVLIIDCIRCVRFFKNILFSFVMGCGDRLEIRYALSSSANRADIDTIPARIRVRSQYPGKQARYGRNEILSGTTMVTSFVAFLYSIAQFALRQQTKLDGGFYQAVFVLPFGSTRLSALRRYIVSVSGGALDRLCGISVVLMCYQYRQLSEEAMPECKTYLIW